jgi:hypothetical protein
MCPEWIGPLTKRFSTLHTLSDEVWSSRGEEDHGDQLGHDMGALRRQSNTLSLSFRQDEFV